MQRLYDYYFRTICGLLPLTPRRILLAELGPLQVLWWQQTLQLWNSLAALPVGSLYHTACLDNLTDAFQGGTCNMASSVAGCLRSLGYDMPRIFDVMPLLDIDSIVEALTVQLQDMGSAALYCPRAAPTRGVVFCTYEQWFRPYSLCRRYCRLPVCGGRMQRFLQLRLGPHTHSAGSTFCWFKLRHATHFPWLVQSSYAVSHVNLATSLQQVHVPHGNI